MKLFKLSGADEGREIIEAERSTREEEISSAIRKNKAHLLQSLVDRFLVHNLLMEVRTIHKKNLRNWLHASFLKIDSML